MELSKRLSAVAAMVTPGNVVCDVGCDHGYVSIFLMESGKSPKVYAMDVRTGPLERAREHIKEYGYEDSIEVILSDGLIRMPEGKADTLICAGMGGRLVIKILSESIEKVRKLKELVLQPQSEIWLVREYLREQGFSIVDEDMVEEDGKYYPILHVSVSGSIHMSQDGDADRQAVCDKYGEVLLEKKHPVLKQYLLWERELLMKIEEELKGSGKHSDKTRARMETLQTEKEQVQRALDYFA